MAASINPINGAPIEETICKIEDQTYTLHWGVLNEYYADSYGVDVKEFWAKAMGSKPGSIADHFRLFAAMVAHIYYANRQPVPPPEHWAALCDAKPQYTRAIFDAVKDVFLQKMKAAAIQQLQAAPPAVQEQKPLADQGDVPQVELKLN